MRHDWLNLYDDRQVLPLRPPRRVLSAPRLHSLTQVWTARAFRLVVVHHTSCEALDGAVMTETR